MTNEIEFFSTNQNDVFNSLASKIITNYNSLGGNLKPYNDSTHSSSLWQLLNKVYVIIFHRGDPLSVKPFLKRVATGKLRGLGKPDGNAFAPLEDTFLGIGHFRNGEAFTLSDKEIKAVQMYMNQSNNDIAFTQFKYKELIIQSVIHKSGVPFPNSKDDKLLHNQFKVTVTNTKTGAKTKFDFFGSYNDYKEGIKELKDADLLNAFECFINDATSAEDDFKDWCDNFGYDSDSRTAHKIYKECVKSLEKAKNIISGDLYEFSNELQEVINN